MAHCWNQDVRRRTRSKQILNEELDLVNGGVVRVSENRMSLTSHQGVGIWVRMTDEEMVELRDALIEHYGDGRYDI